MGETEKRKNRETRGTVSRHVIQLRENESERSREQEKRGTNLSGYVGMEHRTVLRWMGRSSRGMVGKRRETHSTKGEGKDPTVVRRNRNRKISRKSIMIIIRRKRERKVKEEEESKEKESKRERKKKS